MAEIVPAILKLTFEGIARDWERVYRAARHIQIDVTDGIFAGEPSFRDLKRLKNLPESDKLELHMMVHTPANYVDEACAVNPARCVWHVEAFAGADNVRSVMQKMRSATSSELGLALNPGTPTEWIDEHLPLIDFVLFMSYQPGWANQAAAEGVIKKIRGWHEQHREQCLAVDGHVNKETVAELVRAGAGILYSNTAIFGAGLPAENLKQLELLAKADVV